MENSESSPKINNSDSKPTTNWRDVLPIHPACELFPKMSESELDDLAEDIRKNGMRISPVIFAEPGPTKKSPSKYSLIDGYNRLAALERVTPFRIKHHRDNTWTLDPFEIEDGKPLFVGGHLETFFNVVTDVDPVAYVISLNVNRRHLSAEAAREVIGKLLVMDPSQSDRAIARLVKKSPTTVGAIRTELKANGQLSNLDSCRVGRDGRSRRPPVASTRPASSSPSTSSPKASSYKDGVAWWDNATPEIRTKLLDDRIGLAGLQAVLPRSWGVKSLLGYRSATNVEASILETLQRSLALLNHTPPIANPKKPSSSIEREIIRNLRELAAKLEGFELREVAVVPRVPAEVNGHHRFRQDKAQSADNNDNSDAAAARIEADAMVADGLPEKCRQAEQARDSDAQLSDADSDVWAKADPTQH